jgi:pepF/M3 family oligoendopeptidase
MEIGYPKRTTDVFRLLSAHVVQVDHGGACMGTQTSGMRWDLESVFPGGSSSKEFEVFRKGLAEDLDKAKGMLESLPMKLDDGTVGVWTGLFILVQDIDMRLHHAGSFAYCLVAQDVKDEKAMILVEEMTSMEASIEAIKTGLEEFAIGIDDKAWSDFIGTDRLAGTSFYWNERRRRARLKMEPKLEKLAIELAVNGYHAWNLLYTKIAGDLRAEFEEDGKTETLSMGQLSNKMSSPKREIRKQAFEKLEGAWASVDGLAAMELNSLAGFRLSLYRGRGWESPLLEPFLLARVERETIEAMWNAVEGGRKRIADYVSAKKKVLGIDRFRWYDQLAPVGGSEREVAYDEAVDFVVQHLSSFSREMGDFARDAVDNRWIEAEDRPGKMAGGFCTGLPVVKQSRIFMTYSGNYNEIMTLAHEIGHAYHGWVLRDRDYYGRHYTMTLAETASTFNEMLVTDAALEAAANTDERLSLVDRKLQEHLAMFCNLRCRFIFETMFYEERKRGTVARDRLNQLMVEAQKQAFGDILADDGYHPLFWASKMHFSETGVPFYNFPYTFGHLFASGIYDLARKGGQTFAADYKALLVDTGSMTCEEVARKHLGVDLAAGEFWDRAVARALEDVALFIELAGDA